MKKEKDFRVGENCLYYEDGAVFRCEILKKTLVGESLTFILIILSVIKPHPIVNFRAGYIFDIWKNLNDPVHFLAWSIFDEDYIESLIDRITNK